MYSMDMGFVFLGGEHNSSILLHFFASTQVFRRSYLIFTILSLLCAGEFGKTAGLPFCKCFIHIGHLRVQPVGRKLHPEEGENRSPLFDRL